MLLVHQAGLVKVGEVVRYTLTYTPTYDRILPSPTHLHVKIKNTSAIPLRAAYLHGPYTLHVSTYPSSFNPNQKTDSAERDGIPEFEPALKAGGHWTSKLVVPIDIRESGEKVNSKRNLDGTPKTMKWIIEISSQILFSNTATVHYELIVGRDERSLEHGFAAVAGKGHGGPGLIEDFRAGRQEKSAYGVPTFAKGVYSKAVELVVEDTAALWIKPGLPRWEEELVQDTHQNAQNRSRDAVAMEVADTGFRRKKKPKKLHLVILTHGLHSNVGADMLYVKESIDSAAKYARMEAKKRKDSESGKHKKKGQANAGKQTKSEETDAQDDQQSAPAPQSGGQDRLGDDEVDSDDEQVIVRGFAGNACRTERGIQYLGKRLAKYVLTTTYPDQPYLPESRSMRRSSRSGPFGSTKSSHYGASSHNGSSIHSADAVAEQLPYKFTSISFIGHSLGGLVQTYAIAYIHKHAPNFFHQIQPVNFVTMATPLLGLSNENPLYVKFALDFGLVGRTGQDLGLTWRAPNIARTGWRAVIDGFTSSGHDGQKEEDPRAKPLLRVLPTGPAHQVLKMFRNRTVYSNVVNDGIVPLRTSCLLFLDWRGLDRVQNARRANGLIATVANFGWSELTGANTSSHRPTSEKIQDDDTPQDSDDDVYRTASGRRSDVPQPAPNATRDDNDSQATDPMDHQFLSQHGQDHDHDDSGHQESGYEKKDSTDIDRSSTSSHPLDNILHFFRPPRLSLSKSPKVSGKHTKAYRRAQTLKPEKEDDQEPKHRPAASRGDSLVGDRVPPPKTSVFEAAGDIIGAPMPSDSWINDPSSRDRTIFHDRIYHPEDIPPPPQQKAPLLSRTFSSSSNKSLPSHQKQASEDLDGGMKVEEKIARAYHHDLSWRKVLVSLQPDAHNNMVVRRIFANAYGWDVIKHLCDTHFAHTDATLTRDEDEVGKDRAKSANEPVSEHGDQVHDQQTLGHPTPRLHRTTSEEQEATDVITDLDTPAAGVDSLVSGSGSAATNSPRQRQDSVTWSDSVFGDSDDEDGEHEQESLNPFEHFQRFWNGTRQEDKASQHTTAKHHHHKLHDHHHDHAHNDERGYIDTPADHTSRTLPHRSRTPPPNILTDRLTSSPSDSPVETKRSMQEFTHADPERVPAAGSAFPEHESFGSPSSTANLGLRKPPAAHVPGLDSDMRKAPPNGQGQGVAERVARLSST